MYMFVLWAPASWNSLLGFSWAIELEKISRQLLSLTKGSATDVIAKWVTSYKWLFVDLTNMQTVSFTDTSTCSIAVVNTGCGVPGSVVPIHCVIQIQIL